MSPRPPLDSARLAWWLTAWLRGSARPDDVHDAVLDGDAAHHVIGLPGEPDPVPLLLALPALRRTRTRSAGLALPAPGHPCGLGGPAAFNKAALASGEAVVLDGAGLGLLPHRAGAGVMWSLQPAARRPLVDLHEASRALRRVLSEAATRLADLDVAAWNTELADELVNLRHRTHFAHPGGTPTEAVELAGRAQQALDIVGIALEHDGTTTSATEWHLRREALTDLSRAARDAWVAAASPEVWPPERT